MNKNTDNKTVIQYILQKFGNILSIQYKLYSDNVQEVCKSNLPLVDLHVLAERKVC